MAVSVPGRTIEQPVSDERASEVGGGDHVVIVFNNDHNTFDQVIAVLQLATGCSLAEAEMETWEIHHRGRSVVHHGHLEECDRAAKIIRGIGLRVAVEQM